MQITGALVECASDLQNECSHSGIHPKVFLPAEVYPVLKDQYIPNLLKHARDPVYLHWRPAELRRLLCWRLYLFLGAHGFSVPPKVDWNNSQEVKRVMWTPYFGQYVKNGRGVREDSFSYILRHTQLRPRQLVLLCNEIARRSMSDGTFPHFAETAVVAAIRNTEEQLADEVLNSYKAVYDNVADIVSAITGVEARFHGNRLDQLAKRTKVFWKDNQDEYGLHAFRQILTELGIVGRVRSAQTDIGLLEADFEYSMSGRLHIFPDDDCVVHPMFFEKYKVNVPPSLRIMPYPDHPDFEDVRG